LHTPRGVSVERFNTLLRLGHERRTRDGAEDWPPTDEPLGPWTRWPSGVRRARPRTPGSQD